MYYIRSLVEHSCKIWPSLYSQLTSRSHGLAHPDTCIRYHLVGGFLDMEFQVSCCTAIRCFVSYSLRSDGPLLYTLWPLPLGVVSQGSFIPCIQPSTGFGSNPCRTYVNLELLSLVSPVSVFTTPACSKYDWWPSRDTTGTSLCFYP